MIDKKEFLLQSIIKAYIEHLEPIGSTQLKTMYDIAYSPATIRGYFKKLGDEGFLAQEHISSGRTPTTEALRQYWIEKLNFKIESVSMKAIQYFAHQVGVTVFLKRDNSDLLQNIIDVNNKHMILEFTSFAINVKYSNALYRFLNDMIGLSLKDILKISKDVGAIEVYSAIIQRLQNLDFEIFNYKEFLSLALGYNFDEMTIDSFLKAEVINTLEEGLYFEELLPIGYIGVCHKCKVNNQDVKMLVIGDLAKNYDFFYDKIKTF